MCQDEDTWLLYADATNTQHQKKCVTKAIDKQQNTRETEENMNNVMKIRKWLWSKTNKIYHFTTKFWMSFYCLTPSNEMFISFIDVAVLHCFVLPQRLNDFFVVVYLRKLPSNLLRLWNVLFVLPPRQMVSPSASDVPLNPFSNYIVRYYWACKVVDA